MTSTVPRWRLRAFVLAAIMLAVGSVAGLSPESAVAATWKPIAGTGSTWSQNALDQWRKNVATNYGMTINYSGTGSSAGRRDFIAGQVDFAVSEIPFQLKPEDGSAPEKPAADSFAYMPIVAGGTAFMYNLKIGGKKVTNLQLSGETVTKIFTGVITNWNDPVIAADNPTLVLPDKAIIPVVRSDGSGSTAQFTLWMSKQHSALWNAYCGKVGRATPCGLTSQFPASGAMKAQSGSLGVSGYVSQAYGEGGITYVEYSYALKSGFPVARIKNSSGAYVEPTAPNVAIALTKAQINTTVSSPDYLTQILDGVYNNPAATSYPLSSYSYLIVPTKVAGIFTADKGKTLAAFARYLLCDGQLQASQLGYSPLPANLVAAGFDQVKRIPGGEGATACAAGIGAATPGAADGAAPADAAASGGDAAAVGDGTSIGSGGELGGDGTTLTGAQAASSPFTLPKDDFGPSQTLMIGAGVLVVLLVLLPPLFSRRLRRWGPAGRE